MGKVAARNQTRPAPAVEAEQAGQKEEFIEDIGLLQNTFVRAPYRELRKEISTREILGYYWKFVMSRFGGWLSRIVYQRIIHRKKWSLGRIKPVDLLDDWKTGQITVLAKKHYEQLYTQFAKGEMSEIERNCLAPLAKDFSQRVKARGSKKLYWKLLRWHSATVMSHRVTSLGDADPNTAFRQVVVRMKTKQRLFLRDDASSRSVSPTDSTPSLENFTALSKQRWLPEEIQRKVDLHKKIEEEQEGFEDHGDEIRRDQGEIRNVTEYMVMQKRVISGSEDPKWRIWGFTVESTPQRLEEEAEYWRKYNAAQQAAVA